LPLANRGKPDKKPPGQSFLLGKGGGTSFITSNVQCHDVKGESSGGKSLDYGGVSGERSRGHSQNRQKPLRKWEEEFGGGNLDLGGIDHTKESPRRSLRKTCCQGYGGEKKSKRSGDFVPSLEGLSLIGYTAERKEKNHQLRSTWRTRQANSKPSRHAWGRRKSSASARVQL